MILVKNIIDNIDMSWLYNKAHYLDAPYIMQCAGAQHYRLLTYISMLYNNIKISDVGTRRGASAYALAYNSFNFVHTYDIDNQWQSYIEKTRPDNVKFHHKNGLDANMHLQSYIIMLDIDPHDGIMERKFIDDLTILKWKGILIIDDIHWNDPMRHFWGNLRGFRKYDVTDYGHRSGCGIINFSNEDMIFA